MDKKVLFISAFSGLYLALLLSGVASRLASFIATGVVVELLTIPAVILQLSLFVYVMYNLLLKRFKFTVASVTPVAVFLVLFILGCCPEVTCRRSIRFLISDKGRRRHCRESEKIAPSGNGAIKSVFSST